MAYLLVARIAVAWAPFPRWRHRLGQGGVASPGEAASARRLAGHVDRGAMRLGLPLKCLPRAMALSWMLRRRAIGHTLVMAARPASHRGGDPDELHAWVECGGEKVLGKLDGPWVEVLKLPLA